MREKYLEHMSKLQMIQIIKREWFFKGNNGSSNETKPKIKENKEDKFLMLLVLNLKSNVMSQEKLFCW